MQICRDILAGGRRVRHTPPSEEEAELTSGERIRFPTSPDGYDLLHEIGRGVSAVVYKAACRPLASRLVAVKSIDLERAPAHACALEQVRREAKAMSLLSHPNVLRAHCSFAAGKCLWVVMPLMAAGSMQSILSSSFPAGLPEAAVACVLRDVLRALTYLHGEGHVHRDIKAGNVLVGGDGSVKLADFGVSACIYDGFSSSSSSSSASSASSASFSLLREMAGTPCWMAPENRSLESEKIYDVHRAVSFWSNSYEGRGRARAELARFLFWWLKLELDLKSNSNRELKKQRARELNRELKILISSFCISHKFGQSRVASLRI